MWSVQFEGCNIKIQLVTSDAMCLCVFPGQCWWLSHYRVNAVCYSAEFWAWGRGDDWSLWLLFSIYFHTPSSRRWTPAHIMRSGTSTGLFWCYCGRAVEPIYKNVELVLKFLFVRACVRMLFLKMSLTCHECPFSCIAVSSTSVAFTSFVFITLPCTVLMLYTIVSDCYVFHLWFICLLIPCCALVPSPYFPKLFMLLFFWFWL